MKIKLGFLGGGESSIAGRVHLIASQMENKFEVIGGIFSKNKKRSVKSAELYNVKNFNSIAEMAEEVDIIVILTPTPEHFENIKEVLHYNVGIIVDKPLVSNTEELKKLNFNNKFLAVTYNYSGYPLIREMKEYVKRGLLGDINKVVINMYQESFLKPLTSKYPQKWRLKDSNISMLELDLGVHVYHLAYFLLAEKLELLYKQTNKFSNYGIIDDCEIFAKSANVFVKLGISKVMLGNINPLEVQIYGQKAAIKWSQDDCENIYVTYNDGKREIINRGNAKFEANKKRYQRMAPGHPSGFIEAFANLYDDIYDAYIQFLKTGNFQNDYVYGFEHSYDILRFFEYEG